MPMRNKKRPPMLLGEPSPSLAKMGRMNMAALEAQIQALGLERQRLDKKIANLKAATPPAPPQRITQLQRHAARLVALEQAAKDNLQRKQQNKDRWEQSQQQR